MSDKRKIIKNQIKKQLVDVNIGLKDGVFVFSGPMTIGDFSKATKKPINEIIGYFFKQGKMYNINKTLDEEQIAELCLKYRYDFHKEKEINAQNFMDHFVINDKEEEMIERPSIITIMGHVDHGKTTLIDKIRGTHVVDKEAGGITQHTGTYQIEHNNKKITFLDTPGHESFIAMRSRGANITDIVILVVAADDGVMPQTKEAIQHAKAAKVPIIVFVNKMDKHGINIEKIKSDLSSHEVISEDWGGNVQFVYGSALKGDGIKDLFNAILLEAEMLELKSNPNRLPIGIVIESYVDKGKGTIVNVIVKHGTLLKKDFIVAGSKYGRIKSLEDSNGNKIEKAIPGMPISITGLNHTPLPGDKFFGFKDEKFAKNLAFKKAIADKKQNLRRKNIFKSKEGKKIINLIIKSDVQGTAEAIKYSISKLENEEAKINVIDSSVGIISKSDIHLAQASHAIIYSFNSKISSDIIKMAKENDIEIKNYNVIYKMIEDVQNMLKEILTPKYEEKLTGRAQVLQVFFYSKIGNIAGCKMETGFMDANSKVKVYRKDKIIHEGKIDSLQRGTNILKKAEKGKEFGTHIHKFENIKMGDFIESYKKVEIK